VHVSSTHSLDDIAPGKVTDEKSYDDDNIAQEDKPRSAIIAEYLSHGYVIGDQAITNAIALDKKHGISSRFTSALTNFDQKYNATGKAKSVDTKYGVTNTAQTGAHTLFNYFEKAISKSNIRLTFHSLT
jgi:hypothetical protein